MRTNLWHQIAKMHGLEWWSGTAWCFLLALQLKLWFTVRQRVEKMMKTYLGVPVFFCNPHYL
jgi:hypothetical protein